MNDEELPSDAVRKALARRELTLASLKEELLWSLETGAPFELSPVNNTNYFDFLLSMIGKLEAAQEECGMREMKLRELIRLISFLQIIIALLIVVLLAKAFVCMGLK